MLNTVLTVRAHKANSHQGRGWELFTDRLIVGTNELDLPGRGFPLRQYVVLPYEKIRHVEVIADGQHHVMRISTSDDSVIEVPLGDLARRALPRIGAALQMHAIRFD